MLQRGILGLHSAPATGPHGEQDAEPCPESAASGRDAQVCV